MVIFVAFCLIIIDIIFINLIDNLPMSLGRKIEQILKKYYEINMIRLVNFGLYFVV